MAASAPISTGTKSSRSSDPTPPDERFWIRYSPHHEMPLSWVGSGAVHALLFGLLVLAGLAIAFTNDSRSVSIDTVRLGGGGGELNGIGDKAGKGDGENGNESKPNDDNKFKGKVEAGELPKKQDPQFEPLPKVPDAAAQIDRIRQIAILNAGKIREGLARAKGAQGNGAGGGEGRGNGPGKGDTKGPGEGEELSVREKRMLRWTLKFEIRDGADYAKQLRSLGVFIAVETDEPGKARVYEIIEPHAKGEVKEFKDIHQMPWVDAKMESVEKLCGHLGICPVPSRVIAYMTEKMEANLFKMEMKAADGVAEDKIKETVFKIEKRDGRYQPSVESQRLDK